MKYVSALAATGTLVAAQNFAGIPTCAIQCIETGIPLVGCALNDTACQCQPDKQSSLAANPTVVGCLTSNCAISDLLAAESAASSDCAAFLAASGSASTTPGLASVTTQTSISRVTSTSTGSSSESTSISASSGGLSAGAKAGIGVGSVIGVLAIAGLVWFAFRLGRRKQLEGVANTQPHDPQSAWNKHSTMPTQVSELDNDRQGWPAHELVANVRQYSELPTTTHH